MIHRKVGALLEGERVHLPRGVEHAVLEHPIEHVYYIQKGAVKLSVLSKTGKEAVVAMLGPGDFFGEGCLAGQPIRMGSATASFPSPALGTCSA